MRAERTGLKVQSWATTALLMFLVAGCSSSTSRASSSSATPPPLVCAQLLPDLRCSVVSMSRFTTVSIGRFTVGFDPQVVRSSSAIGVSLQSDVAKDLTRIAALLPGPAAVIIVEQTTNVTPQTGALGYTDPATGQVLIQLDPESQVPFSETLAMWLPEVLAHEIHHCVRILSGPGFGDTLGAYLVSEGMASAFFHQAFPGTDAPWDNALTLVQEHALWARAKTVLTQGRVQLYEQWFFGGQGVPEWTGFTIGYHLAEAYIEHHPGTSAASLVDAPASTILAGSGYAP